MNIKEAKEQIKNAMTVYFAKDEKGNYKIPVESQRPVFLLGAPGIGKTAIMKQIAEELGVGLVSYSMTHHTRQSALGLPYITTKKYGNEEYQVSEYTMSEIIASVYDQIEETGIKEGILFLDEINCVSETLTPSMLQFLQFKTFGRHQIPEGWIVVTAGNPPEYNKSVKEFDIVTMDRLKLIKVEPEFDVWKEYGYLRNIHPSVLTYLEIKKNYFYLVETTINGKTFVTARGWEDLSRMIRLYEEYNLTVDRKLVEQYLQNNKIARDFATYYDLFNKYKSDYQIDDILNGIASDEIKMRAKNAKFDERIALLGLCIDKITTAASKISEMEKECLTMLNALKKEKAEIAAENANSDAEKVNNFELKKAQYTAYVGQLKESSSLLGNQLNALFLFCEEAFTGGQELLLLVTELTINQHVSNFISHYGCEKYFEHNKNLMFYERNQEIGSRIAELNL